ncbi:LysR family transcriptional regulator [uncultured Propionibacterium sp.]|uniref:LysR family transcriptional regulator n=1 Tax=uncultured Propionibacterium sp. TaxID=218066 RepID=UPI0037DC0E74
MDFRVLRCFLMVARERNMPRAARTLFVTQPMPSRRIAGSSRRRASGCSAGSVTTSSSPMRGALPPRRGAHLAGREGSGAGRRPVGRVCRGTGCSGTPTRRGDGGTPWAWSGRTVSHWDRCGKRHRPGHHRTSGRCRGGRHRRRACRCRPGADCGVERDHLVPRRGYHRHRERDRIFWRGSRRSAADWMRWSTMPAVPVPPPEQVAMDEFDAAPSALTES